jgi:hypothetical protein
MTEMVTINAAREAQQLSLLAQRPDVSYRDPNQPNTIQVSQAGVQPDARRAAQTEAGAQKNGQQDLSQRRDRPDQGITGPSRPRVEIRDFDVGRTPAEVVGTMDVVQRFDNNNDGRIDLIEANRATRSRNTDTSTFAGLAPGGVRAAQPQGDGPTPAEVEIALAEKAVEKPAFGPVVSPDPTLRADRDQQAQSKYGPAVPGTPQAQAGEIKKYADKADAGQGYVGGEQQVAQKYFGKGAEAVLGQFAAPDQPQKYADKAQATETAKFSEAGSGEAKYADKVAQTETDFAGAGQQDQPKSMYDRAQEVRAGVGESAPGLAKKAVPAAGAYGQAVVASDGKPVVVQVTA